MTAVAVVYVNCNKAISHLITVRLGREDRVNDDMTGVVSQHKSSIEGESLKLIIKGAGSDTNKVGI